MSTGWEGRYKGLKDGDSYDSEKKRKRKQAENPNTISDHRSFRKSGFCLNGSKRTARMQ